jgi:hypothetical protein
MPTAADLLERTTPEVRPIVERLRALMAEVLPEATETVDLPDNLLAYGTGRKLRDLVVGIIPHAAHVNVQLADAVDLADPAGLLEGTGKRIRHVKNRSLADAERPALRDLIRAQWEFHTARS